MWENLGRYLSGIALSVGVVTGTGCVSETTIRYQPYNILPTESRAQPASHNPLPPRHKANPYLDGEGSGSLFYPGKRGGYGSAGFENPATHLSIPPETGATDTKTIGTAYVGASDIAGGASASSAAQTGNVIPKTGTSCTL